MEQQKVKCGSCKRMLLVKTYNTNKGFCGNCINKRQGQLQVQTQSVGQLPVPTSLNVGQLPVASSINAGQVPVPVPMQMQMQTPMLMPVQPLGYQVDTTDKSKASCGRCGGVYKVETINKYGGVCWNCRRFIDNPKNANKPPSPRQLCAGTCNKSYLTSTLAGHNGVCGRCRNKTQKSQVVPQPVMATMSVNQIQGMPTLPTNPFQGFPTMPTGNTLPKLPTGHTLPTLPTGQRLPALPALPALPTGQRPVVASFGQMIPGMSIPPIAVGVIPNIDDLHKIVSKELSDFEPKREKEEEEEEEEEEEVVEEEEQQQQQQEEVVEEQQQEEVVEEQEQEQLEEVEEQEQEQEQEQ